MFAHVVGLQTLSPSAPVWRNPPNDMTTMMAGYEAVVHEPWRFPPTVTSRLLSPDAISIVYTDSIPWLTLGLKALGLGEAVNPLGFFYLLSYLLQPVGMVWLLDACGVRRRGVLLAGAALALLVPTWYVRQFGHVALTGHFIILFALALSAASARLGLTWGRTAGFCALAALAAGVHAYHLLPVAAAFGAVLLSEILQRRPKAWTRCAVAAVLVLGCLGASVVLLGYGLGQGRASRAETLGFWSMNLAAPVWPQASALAGQNWNGNWFPGGLDATGGQAVAGYAYLGAGVLLLIGVALIVGAKQPGPEAESAAWGRRWAPLVLAILALTALAVGPKIYFGMTRLAELPVPRGKLGDAISLFRAHGRFIWAPGYMALAAALVVLDRRARPAVLATALVLAVALQAYDVKELQQGVRATYAHPAPARYPAALTAPVLSGRPWRIYPTYFCSEDLGIQATAGELSLVAIRSGGSTNTANTARPPLTGCEIPPAALRAPPPGDRTVTVALDGGDISSPLPGRFAGRDDCWRFRLGMVCGRGLETLGLTRVDPAELALAAHIRTPDAVYRFDGVRSPLLKDGWSATEPTGTWSDGPRAVIALPLPKGLPADARLVIQLEGLSYAPPPKDGQRVTVSLEGRPVATWQVSSGPWGVYHLIIPRSAATGDAVRLAFDFPEATSPGEPDERLLGMGVRKLTVSH